jgi:hypothetical protein
MSRSRPASKALKRKKERQNPRRKTKRAKTRKVMAQRKKARTTEMARQAAHQRAGAREPGRPNPNGGEGEAALQEEVVGGEIDLLLRLVPFRLRCTYLIPRKSGYGRWYGFVLLHYPAMYDY